MRAASALPRANHSTPGSRGPVIRKNAIQVRDSNAPADEVGRRREFGRRRLGRVLSGVGSQRGVGALSLRVGDAEREAFRCARDLGVQPLRPQHEGPFVGERPVRRGADRRRRGLGHGVPRQSSIPGSWASGASSDQPGPEVREQRIEVDAVEARGAVHEDRALVGIVQVVAIAQQVDRVRPRTVEMRPVAGPEHAVGADQRGGVGEARVGGLARDHARASEAFECGRRGRIRDQCKTFS